MPVLAEFAAVSRALPLDSHQQCRIKRITLRAVTPLPRALSFAFLPRGLFHAWGGIYAEFNREPLYRRRLLGAERLTSPAGAPPSKVCNSML